MEHENIVVQHYGVWDGDNKFSNVKLYGVLLPLDCSYVNFVAEIKRQVGMGTTIEALEIKYQLKEGYQPLQISNEMSLQEATSCHSHMQWLTRRMMQLGNGFFNASERHGIRDEMCILSDRCESILRAAALVYPSVPHCICIFHCETT